MTRGRPPRDGATATKTLRVRLTDEEWKRYERVAAKLGTTLSDLARGGMELVAEKSDGTTVATDARVVGAREYLSAYGPMRAEIDADEIIAGSLDVIEERKP